MKVNQIISNIFCLYVLVEIAILFFSGNFLRAIYLYAAIGLFFYIGFIISIKVNKLYYIKTKAYKFILFWMPILLSKRIDRWAIQRDGEKSDE